MSWFSRLFGSGPPLIEYDADAEFLKEMEVAHREAKLKLGEVTKLLLQEQRKLDDIRRRVSDARIEEMRVNGTMRYTKVKAELDAVRASNEHLTRALLEAHRRAEDEAIKRRVAFELSKGQ